MRVPAWVASLAVVAVLALNAIPEAQAQSVTFSDINDAVPGKFFDAATSAPDPYNPNRLIIGINTGTDPKLWTSNTFTASTQAFYRASAMDTISFRVQAPDGYYIATLTYTQKGTGSVARSGRAGGGAHWVIDDTAADLGLFGANPSLSGTIDLTGQNRIFVPVSITSSLFAFAPPGLGSASVGITSADVLIGLLPLSSPEPEVEPGAVTEPAPVETLAQ